MPLQRQDGRFIVLFILVGIALMLGTLLYGVKYSQADAQNTMDENISDLKKQINDYNDFLALDEVKSLTRLTDKAEDISKTLAVLDKSKWKEYIETIYDSQRLSCILVLDEDLNPIEGCVATGESYDDWSTELQSAAVAGVLEHPKKLYSARLSRDGSGTYDIAVVTRTDENGVVFCAAQQTDENLELNYSAVKNLLARNETRLNGRLYIAENGKIIAANQEQASTVEDIPELVYLQEHAAGGTLTRFVSDGNVFYGGCVKCRSYDIFVFYPASAVYSSCRTIMLVAFVIFVLIGLVIGAINFKSREYHARAINRQYEITKTISHVHSLTVLINLKAQRYELLKYPTEWSDIAEEGAADTQFYEKFIGYVDEQFRSDYRDFLNFQTLDERLADKKYVEYDYRNSAGEWLNDKLIVHEKDKNGKIKYVIFARRSINEQKKKELEYRAKLKAAAKNEQKANQSKTDFLRRMSHDIRTPINVIIGMLEIGSRNPTDTELLSSCRSKAQTAAEYLLELVNDILTLNREDRTDSADTQKSVEAFRLSEEVQKLYQIAVEQVKRYDGVTLEPVQLSGEDKPLLGESLYLRQIMMNIITNAMRYSRKGGVVRAFVSQKPSQSREGYAEVRFVCEDNGIGMSKEFQKTMFEPFAQESAVSISRLDGVGLGLSIVQKLVNKLNGSIDVESEQGRGTRFTITISYPYAETPDEVVPQTDGNSSLEGLTVLVVEDNELNMEIAEFMVTESGANVVKAFNGAEAVEKFAASAVGAIDVILTDVTMPEMDGLEETRRIRALDRPDAKTVPIIAMTANLFEEDINRYTAAGMTGVLPKPLNIDQLIETVKKQASKGGKSNA